MRQDIEETRRRVYAAAEEIWEADGRTRMPAVQEVRRRAGVGSQAANALMQEWRAKKEAQAGAVEPEIPEALRGASTKALQGLWAAAVEHARAAERARGESDHAKERAALEETTRGLSVENEGLSAELRAAQARIEELSERAARAEGRAESHLRSASQADGALACAQRTQEALLTQLVEQRVRAENAEDALEAAEARLAEFRDQARAHREVSRIFCDQVKWIDAEATRIRETSRRTTNCAAPVDDMIALLTRLDDDARRIVRLLGLRADILLSDDPAEAALPAERLPQPAAAPAP